ncbi:unnamed protein product, partial [Urochloa humidicola]
SPSPPCPRALTSHTYAPTGGPNSIPPRADRRRQREWRERRTGGKRGRLPGGAPPPALPHRCRRGDPLLQPGSSAGPLRRVHPQLVTHLGVGPLRRRPRELRSAPACRRRPAPAPTAARRERERETATATTLAAAGDLRSSAVEARARELEREAGTTGVGWSSTTGIAAASSAQARRPWCPRARRRVHRPPPVPPRIELLRRIPPPDAEEGQRGEEGSATGERTLTLPLQACPPSICWGRRRGRSGRGPAGNQRA